MSIASVGSNAYLNSLLTPAASSTGAPSALTSSPAASSPTSTPTNANTAAAALSVASNTSALNNLAVQAGNSALLGALYGDTDSPSGLTTALQSLIGDLTSGTASASGAGSAQSVQSTIAVYLASSIGGALAPTASTDGLALGRLIDTQA